MSEHAGHLLRGWRRRRRVTQLDLAHRAGVSSRHVSYVETGRSRPTSQMILRLCAQLDVPPREQNRCLLAAGWAPAHPERSLDDPSLAQVADAVERVLTAHAPYPALVVDAGWDLVSANDAVYSLLEGVDLRLLEPPVNVVRLSLDARGLAPRIVNLGQWRAHLIGRLAREHDASGDPRIAALLTELGEATDVGEVVNTPELVVPLRLRVAGDAELSLISTTTVFGTAREVTVSELTIEAFYPADEATRALLSGLTSGSPA